MIKLTYAPSHRHKLQLFAPARDRPGDCHAIIASQNHRQFAKHKLTANLSCYHLAVSRGRKFLKYLQQRKLRHLGGVFMR